MSWIYLVLAGLFEVGWVLGLKQSDGFTKLGPSIVTVALMGASFAFLALALKSLPVGTAYAVWTGIGALGAVAAGIVFFGESKDLPKLICVGLIAVGIIGLKIVSKH